MAGTFAILAILLCLLPSLSRDWFSAFIGGMRLHIAIAAFLFSLAFICIGRTAWHAPPLFIAAALLLYVGYLHETVVQRAAAGTPGASFRLIEFNMLGDNDRGGDIAAWLIAEKADVIYALESGPLRAHLPELEKVYPYRIGCGEMTTRCDLMMLSRHPLEDGKLLSMGSLRSERFIRASIELDGRQVNLVAAHFTKPFFDAIQQDELRVAQRRLRRIEGPVVLGGDFNSSLLSPDIIAFMKASGLRAHAHEPRTWPVNIPAIGLPIDHILVRAPAHIDSLKRMPDALGSNHFGLIADISLRETAR
ncbi:hypothetical protein TM49_10370 [Martelella endophytica]|uniref:Endonuclease/exonuclease/phosphatase domain-containing protein n=1 Tax=Martelella endophytica TaxID=1486262 RepID=A0A0D5LVX1_MAREN|nr:hypothetical protein TM49_10370 [Martelella endophytica]